MGGGLILAVRGGTIAWVSRLLQELLNRHVLAGTIPGGVALSGAGNAGLEAAALVKVASGEVSGMKVRYWAAQYREWSPVDISDLEHLRRHSSAEIRREVARYFPEDSQSGEPLQQITGDVSGHHPGRAW